MSKPTHAHPAPRLTPWIDGRVRPAREGVYLRQKPPPYACWEGRRWRTASASPAEAARQIGPSRHQNVEWRGLVAPAGAPCATCRGHTIIDRGWDAEAERDLIEECPDC